MDGAELILDSLWLAFGKNAARTNHINADIIIRLFDDVEDAHILTACRLGRRDGRFVGATSQLLHLDVVGHEVWMLDHKTFDVLLHVASRQSVLLIVHNSQCCGRAKSNVLEFLVDDENSLLHVIEQVEVVLLL